MRSSLFCLIISAVAACSATGGARASSWQEEFGISECALAPTGRNDCSYPGTPVPKIRYWVIFNNQLRPPPEVVEPNWKSVVPRSLVTSTRTATVNSIRHLYALAAVSQLKSGVKVEVRYIAVPDDWAPPRAGLFIKEVMNELADMGESMGAEPSSWRTAPP